MATTGAAGHWTEREEGGAGPISKLRNNKRQIRGTEWSMSKVGNPPPHNLYKIHGLVYSIKNKNNKNNKP